MGNVIDLTGKKFGAWNVIECAGRNKSGGATWLCVCDCGTARVVDGRSLRSGASTCCGCLTRLNASKASVKHTTKHSGRNERLYSVWCGIKARCLNKNSKYYSQYGGRGIFICDEWKDYASFRLWAISAGYDENAKHGACTIDRINNEDGYYPENCRWVSSMVQCNNRRSNHLIEYNGDLKTISEWARCTGIRKDTLRRRIVDYGWPIDRALTEPVHNK